MKRYISGLLAVGIMMLAGCTKEVPAQAPETIRETIDVTTEVSVFAEHPDKDGYYTIDQPRSQQDVDVLSQINNRLYFVSVAMVDENIRGFYGAPSELIWRTIAMEVSFNYGSMKPFAEHTDGKGTSISTKDLDKFVKSCFEVDGEVKNTGYPENFKAQGDVVDVEYSEVVSSVPGFMMTHYRQDGDSWFIKGEIIGEGNTIYTSGEFHLESTSDGEPVLYRIKSFIGD